MIFDLNKITVKQYYDLSEEKAQPYQELLKVLQPEPSFLNMPAQEIGSLEYGQAGLVKRAILNPEYKSLVKAFELVFQVPEFLQLKAQITDYFAALRWITKEVEKIIEREAKYLSGRPDPLLKMAGVEQLSKFGELPALKMLGTQYGKAPQEIATWKYNYVFSLLYMDVVEDEIRERYNELKNSQTNAKN